MCMKHAINHAHHAVFKVVESYDKLISVQLWVVTHKNAEVLIRQQNAI